jgi:hypothetical protein
MVLGISCMECLRLSLLANTVTANFRVNVFREKGDTLV